MNNQGSTNLKPADADYLLKLLKLYQQYVIKNKDRFFDNEFKMHNFNNIITSINNLIKDLEADTTVTLSEQQIINLYAIMELVENDLATHHQDFLMIIESLDNNLSNFINRVQLLKSVIIKMTAK